MKSIINVLLAAVIAGCSFGCTKEPAKTESTLPAESFEEESAESAIPLEKEFEDAAIAYPFLKSKYSVSAQKTMHDIEYSYKYYFWRGSLVGVMQTVLFPNAKSAREYYAQVSETCEHAIIRGKKVTHFMADDAVYYGYSLEKLEFVLETSEFEYVLNFDRDAFIKKYGKDN